MILLPKYLGVILMKLVLEHSIGDGYTWNVTAHVPFEYESKEKFLYDLMSKCIECVDAQAYSFKFLGIDFKPTDFGYFEYPEKRKGYDFYHAFIYTLDEWFEKNKAQDG